MPDAAPAVFLSYASQDAEPVRRLCEALRAAGVEVWFDQNELTGGDAWDQKIRGQIKACALFVPVISAGTQARREGYFRIEWKLAAQRTHAIADGTPFLLPVVIDGTRDGEALVPEEFRAVQWTRLPGGEATAAFCAQVKRLLASGGAVLARDEALFKKQRPGSRGIFAALGVLALGAVVFIALRPRAQLPATAAAVEPAAVKNNEAPAAFSPARQMAEKARAMSLEYYDSTADDYAAAEGLIKRALELDQNDAEIWTISSLFNTGIRTRGFDHSPARPNAALRDASRALKLAPDSITARFALGRAQLDTDRTGATETFKQILVRDPNNVGAMGSMAWIYDQEGRIDESAALYERLVQQDPSRLALTRYTEFLLYFHYGRFAEADRAVRQSIAVKPSANSVAGLSILTLTWKGDTEEAIRIFEQAPSSMRNEPRTVWMTVLVQLCRRKPDEALKVLDRLSTDYVQDSWFTGPKSYFVGRAQAMAGRPEAARAAWESGLATVDELLKTRPDDAEQHLMRGQLLAWLGRTEDALQEVRTVTELRRNRVTDIWFDSVLMIYAALGRADDAIPILERITSLKPDANVVWLLTPALLRLDPVWDKLRGDPRFQALCQEPPVPSAAVAAH